MRFEASGRAPESLGDVDWGLTVGVDLRVFHASRSAETTASLDAIGDDRRTRDALDDP